MIDSLAEIYRCVAWLTKFTDASRHYQKIMVAKNPLYARYTKTEIRNDVLNNCSPIKDEATGRYLFQDDDLWHNYFLKERMLAERLVELGIDSMQQLAVLVYGTHLDHRLSEGWACTSAIGDGMV